MSKKQTISISIACLAMFSALCVQALPISNWKWTKTANKPQYGTKEILFASDSAGTNIVASLRCNPGSHIIGSYMLSVHPAPMIKSGSVTHRLEVQFSLGGFPPVSLEEKVSSGTTLKWGTFEGWDSWPEGDIMPYTNLVLRPIFSK